MDIDKRYTIKVSAEEQELMARICDELEQVTGYYDLELNGYEMSTIMWAIANEWDCPDGNLKELITFEYEGEE